MQVRANFHGDSFAINAARDYTLFSSILENGEQEWYTQKMDPR